MLVILDWIWKPKYNIPTPCRIPILGNMVFLGAQPHLKLTEWARKYGRLFSLHMFGHQIVVLNGYEAIQEALVVKGEFVIPNVFNLQIVGNLRFNHLSGVKSIARGIQKKPVQKKFA